MKFTYIESPLGPLLAVRDQVGLTGLYLPTSKHPVSPRQEWTLPLGSDWWLPR